MYTALGILYILTPPFLYVTSTLVSTKSIIGQLPILIVLDLATIDVPLNPTLSSIMIFAVLDSVLNFVGANIELDVHLLEEEII